MKKNIRWNILAGAVLAILFSLSPVGESFAGTPTEADLVRATALRTSRKYVEARSLYAAIAHNASAPAPLRQEAGYWMGFCNVVSGSFLGAIRDFRWFLDAFPGEKTRYLADTLYVLARTYEVVGQPGPAAYYYRQCLRSKAAQGTSFPAKAREGLARVTAMLDIEARQKRNDPLFGQDPASASAPLFDPYTRRPLTRDQYTRIRTFLDRVGANMPLDAALQELPPEDQQLELVKRLVAQLRAQKARQSAVPGRSKPVPPKPGTKKNAEKGKPPPSGGVK
ncbi:MAG: hypothetical protein GX442_26330 [Candidatus Riflebacteria bacterium]|nr:hypothetical protein [Candidatus Riflebacteria bacterium]